MKTKLLSILLAFMTSMVIDCAAQGTADLAPVAVGWSGQPTAGQQLLLTMTVTNIGNGSASGNWHDAWLLCSNASPDSAVPNGGFEIPNCFCTRPTVPPNGSYMVSNSFKLPLLPPATYYLIGIPNNEDNAFETNYANNLSPPVPIPLGVPDMVPVSVGWSGQPTAGQQLLLTMTVTNVGNGFAGGNWHDAWLLCSNASPDSVVPNGVLEIPNCFCTRPTLLPNGSYTVSNSFMLPDVPPATYYLIGMPNNEDNVFETNYANNTSQAVSIPLGVPDLVPVSVGWSGQPTAGQQLLLNMVVTNLGSGFVGGNWHDEWLLCSNTSPASVVPGGTLEAPNCFCTRPTLLPNGSYLASYNPQLPGVPPATYYLIGYPNNEGNVFETNYANNYSVALAITIGTADFIATNLSIGSPAIAGMDLAVSFAVTNISTNAYSSYWYDGVTLSTSATLAGAITNWDWYGYHSTTPGGGYLQNQVIHLPGIAAGNYYLIAQADDRTNISDSDRANNLQALSVIVTNRPPFITLWTPTNLVQLTSCVPVSFALSAGIQLTSYAITNVAFFDGNGTNIIGQVANAPYKVPSQVLDHGSHVISVWAVDKFGLSATSLLTATVSVDWPGQTNVLRADVFSNTCVICMAALNGTNYVIEAKTNLTSPDWLPLATNQVTGTQLVFTNQRTTPVRFYRARY
jgi:hypothetical protein